MPSENPERWPQFDDFKIETASRKGMIGVMGYSGSAAGETRRQMLHDLSNILTSIRSNLELALLNEGRPEAKTFLLQAQEGTYRGARAVTEMRQLEIGSSAGAMYPALTGPQPHAEPKTEAPAEAVSLEGNERILIAEDEEAIRMLINAVLSYRGYRVEEAADGDEAVKQYRENGPFDLVILDLRMPRVDGRSALEQIRSFNPKARAMVLSGLPFEGPGGAPSAITAGFDGRLSKPFDNTELLKTVRLILDRET